MNPDRFCLVYLLSKEALPLLPDALPHSCRVLVLRRRVADSVAGGSRGCRAAVAAVAGPLRIARRLRMSNDADVAAQLV